LRLTRSRCRKGDAKWQAPHEEIVCLITSRTACGGSLKAPLKINGLYKLGPTGWGRMEQANKSFMGETRWNWNFTESYWLEPGAVIASQ
jgi:hypothetical protein